MYISFKNNRNRTKEKPEGEEDYTNTSQKPNNNSRYQNRLGKTNTTIYTNSRWINMRKILIKPGTDPGIRVGGGLN